jgi:phosphoglycolate phosphatase-like HAD superfamily hydrolase
MLDLIKILSRRDVLATLLAVSIWGIDGAAAQAPDPLPSWSDGTKRVITDFVARVTTQGAPDFVPLDQRIATFDNDGTLWAEQPIYFQVAFAIDQVKANASKHPEWKTKQPFKAVLDNDRKALAAAGEKGLLQIVAATHAGMTTEEFTKTVENWIATARHPRFNRPYTDLVYQPMLELLAYMRANGFKTFIVSGGGIEFMRPWTEKVYGIPPEQVVGSSGVTKWQMGPNGKPVLLKEAKVEFVDDGPGKPVGINRFIGRRPIFAFGNSDGDQQMLEWTAAGSGARFMGIVHHTDAEREWAYDRKSQVGKLDKAWDEAVRRGWLVVDMKRDWKVIFPFQK